MMHSEDLSLPAGKRAAAAIDTGKLINAHYLEIQYLLERVERSSNHYQTLGVERSASCDDIVSAYHQAVGALHPSYYKVRAAVPDEMLLKIDQAFEKISTAFAVLTTPAKKAEYDKSLQPRAAGSGEVAASGKCNGGPAAPAADPTRNEPTEVKTTAALRPVFTKAAKKEDVNRRRCERYKLSVPALVTGHDRTAGKWQEITKTIDVGRLGVGVRLKKHVVHGAILHVTLPLPAKLRCHGFSDPGYSMYAIVRRIAPVADGVKIVGLEFIGSHPPAGYLYKPWGNFRTEKWTGPNRRAETRVERAESIFVEYLDESQQLIRKDNALTENLSPCGARICLKGPPPDFDLVRITKSGGEFNSLAFVRNQYTDRDGAERLCVQFIDRQWPL